MYLGFVLLDGKNDYGIAFVSSSYHSVIVLELGFIDVIVRDSGCVLGLRFGLL
jgi:hypothetical protein